MFSVREDGPRRYQLTDGTGAELGWIRGRAIGFRRFRNRTDAIAAASAGWRSLQSLLRRQYAAWPRQVVAGQVLRFVHDGAHEWVSDGRIPLARVQRLAHDLAVEFVVPSWMDDEAMIPLAHALRDAVAPWLRTDVAAVDRESGTPVGR